MSLRHLLAAQLKSWRRRLDRSRGASAVEYGLMCVLIFVVVLGGVASVGSSLNVLFADLAVSMASWT